MKWAWALVLLSSAGCFQAWPLVGPYTCNLGSCPAGLTCDDGLCCAPGGAPACRTLVLDGGVCASGAQPKTYYEDLDGDGYGNPKAPKLLCSKPVVQAYVDNALDCDDSSAEANPKGTEKCDGLDNNCNDVIDEGLTPVKTYFRDQDGDGFGDPASAVIACALPKGFVESNNDCDPSAFTVHPGATELCNGVDDDCNNLKDDNPTDVGGDCLSSGKGECAAGKTACVAAAKVCQSLHQPKPDVCDTLDNNCNGTVDEQPDCGGPVSLRVGPGVVGGAEDMNRDLPFAEQISGCHKGISGATGETWSVPSWTGSGGSDHLLYFEAPLGSWDLSKGGLKLHLAMGWTMLNPTATPWAASSQPVVYLCGDLGFARYVHTSTDGGTAQGSLLNATSGSFDEVIPLSGGNQWVLGGGSSIDLKKVKRIEVLVRPNGVSGATTPTFTFTVTPSAGFVP